jgi:hypothetical protein
MLAATMGEHETAEGHFTEALAMHERMGTRPWTVRTQVAYAELLLESPRQGDRERANALLASAGATAGELGMAAVLARVNELAPHPATTVASR